MMYLKVSKQNLREFQRVLVNEHLNNNVNNYCFCGWNKYKKSCHYTVSVATESLMKLSKIIPNPWRE